MLFIIEAMIDLQILELERDVYDVYRNEAFYTLTALLAQYR